jgi:hypothetical protein
MFFDLGTVLGLLQTQGADENALVGHGGRHPFELGQAAVRTDQAFENGWRVESGWVEMLEGR